MPWDQDWSESTDEWSQGYAYESHGTGPACYDLCHAPLSHCEHDIPDAEVDLFPECCWVLEENHDAELSQTIDLPLSLLDVIEKDDEERISATAIAVPLHATEEKLTTVTDFDSWDPDHVEKLSDNICQSSNELETWKTQSISNEFCTEEQTWCGFKCDDSTACVPCSLDERRETKKETITRAVLQSKFHLSRKQAAKEFGIGLTYLKRLCRNHNIKRWPSRKIQAILNVTEQLNMMLMQLERGQTSANNSPKNPTVSPAMLKSCFLTSAAKSGVDKNPDACVVDTTAHFNAANKTRCNIEELRAEKQRLLSLKSKIELTPDTPLNLDMNKYLQRTNCRVYGRQRRRNHISKPKLDKRSKSASTKGFKMIEPRISNACCPP
eukprot:SAG11_NODE_922_length_6540_cov_45.267816_5_plen_381_part_00